MISTVLKVCAGVFSVGAITFVPIYFSSFLNKSPETQSKVNQVSFQETKKLKILTDSDQLKQDELFDICQKRNTKFKVRGDDGSIREISELEYKGTSRYIVGVTYPQGVCTREVKSQK